MKLSDPRTTNTFSFSFSFSFFGIELPQIKLDEFVEDVMNLDINKESMNDNHGHNQE